MAPPWPNWPPSTGISQWWVLAYDGKAEFTGDLHATAARKGVEFAAPLPQLIAATAPESVQRWALRDRKALK